MKVVYLILFYLCISISNSYAYTEAERAALCAANPSSSSCDSSTNAGYSDSERTALCAVNPSLSICIPQWQTKPSSEVYCETHSYAESVSGI